MHTDPEQPPQSAATSPSRWRRKQTISVSAALALGAVLIVTAALTVLWWPDERRASTAEPVSAGIPSPPTPLESAHSGKCVSVTDVNVDEARAYQFGCTGAPARMWYLQEAAGHDIGKPLYRIVNTSNDKCLSFSDDTFGSARVVVQRPCASGNADGQLWMFDIVDEDPRNDWIYGRFLNIHSLECLDINGGSIDDGTPVIQWGCSEQLNQLFRVMKKSVY